MVLKFSHIVSIAFLFSCSISKSQTQVIEIKTTLGTIIAELYQEKAPVTTSNFLRYVQHGKYDSASFYRVVRMDNQPNNKIRIEVIQGGLGFDRMDSGYPPIEHETTKKTGLLHKTGTLSMARNEPGSASSEFFICIGDQPELDYGGLRNPDGQGFAAFGQIIEGMEIVKQIQNQEDVDQMLKNPIIIKSISK